MPQCTVQLYCLQSRPCVCPHDWERCTHVFAWPRFTCTVQLWSALFTVLLGICTVQNMHASILYYYKTHAFHLNNQSQVKENNNNVQIPPAIPRSISFPLLPFTQSTLVCLPCKQNQSKKNTYAHARETGRQQAPIRVHAYHTHRSCKVPQCLLPALYVRALRRNPLPPLNSHIPRVRFGSAKQRAAERALHDGTA